MYEKFDLKGNLNLGIHIETGSLLSKYGSGSVFEMWIRIRPLKNTTLENGGFESDPEDTYSDSILKKCGILTKTEHANSCPTLENT